MKNPIRKLLEALDVDGTAAGLSELEEKRRAEAKRLDNAERERGHLALAAEAGDEMARAELDALIPRIKASKRRLADLDAAIEAGTVRKGEASNKATQRRVRDKLKRLNALVAKRLDCMARGEKLMRELADVFDQADACRPSIEALCRDLGFGQIVHFGGPLREADRQERLKEFAVDIGLGKHMGIDRYIGSLLRNRGKSLRAIEAEALRQYEINERDALRAAGIAPGEQEARHGEVEAVPE